MSIDLILQWIRKTDGIVKTASIISRFLKIRIQFRHTNQNKKSFAKGV